MPGCYGVHTDIGCTVLKGQILLKTLLVGVFFFALKRIEGEV